MGMDLTISRKRNIGTPNEESVEVYYARKFWELLNAPFVVEYNDSKIDCYVRARIQSKEDIEQLIDIAVHNRDYWDTFDSVPKLCELLEEFDEMREDGWIYYLIADW